MYIYTQKDDPYIHFNNVKSAINLHFILSTYLEKKTATYMIILYIYDIQRDNYHLHTEMNHKERECPFFVYRR